MKPHTMLSTLSKLSIEVIKKDIQKENSRNMLEEHAVMMLHDSDAQFEVKYTKEPENIDEAMYHVVNFVQTKHRGIQEGHTDRKFKK